MSEGSNSFDTPSCETFRSPGTSCPSLGWTAITRTPGFLRLRNRLHPVTVPQVPSETNRCVMAPSVWCQISGPVVSSCARALRSFSYWFGMT